MRDDEFYNATSLDGIKRNQYPSPSLLGIAKEQSKNFPLDKKLYLVRGQDLFVIESNDILVEPPINGERTITIRKAKMVKYTNDGRIISD